MANKNTDASAMLKDAVILFLITLISGLILGFVYQITKEPIARQEEKAIQQACAAVFPEETDMSFRELTYAPQEELRTELLESGVEIGTVYEAVKSDGAAYGYVVEAVTKEGYGGNIVLYVGVSLDAQVSGVSILEISETPGLGIKAEEVLVPQFAGKAAEPFTYTRTGSTSPQEVDAISGATVTTKAVVNAVNGAVRVLAMDLQEGGE